MEKRREEDIEMIGHPDGKNLFDMIFNDKNTLEMLGSVLYDRLPQHKKEKMIEDVLLDDVSCERLESEFPETYAILRQNGLDDRAVRMLSCIAFLPDVVISHMQVQGITAFVLRPLQEKISALEAQNRTLISALNNRETLE